MAVASLRSGAAALHLWFKIAPYWYKKGLHMPHNTRLEGMHIRNSSLKVKLIITQASQPREHYLNPLQFFFRFLKRENNLPFIRHTRTEGVTDTDACEGTGNIVI